MAERTPGGAVATQPTAEGEERTWTTMLGTSARSITVQRTFPAPPRRVLDAIGKVFPAQPYALKLQDTVGGHPLDGGVMVFEVPMLRAGTVVGGQGISMFSYRMTSIEVDRVTVRIRAVDGSRSTTEVAIQGDLRSGLRKNWKVDRGIAATMAVVGGGIAAAIGIGPLALGLAVAAAPAAAGAALFGAGSLGWYRWLYRSALTQSQAELERLLAAVDGEIRSEMVFGDLRTQRLPPG